MATPEKTPQSSPSKSPTSLYSPSEVRHIPLSLTHDYAKSWSLWDGIREIVQNWHDGVHMAFEEMYSIPAHVRNPIVFKELTQEKNSSEHRFKAFVSDKAIDETEQELGEIWYDAESNRLSLINRKTSLEKKILLLGYSSKCKAGAGKSYMKKKEVIGQFGEGLKVGALALVREGRMVTMETCKDRWRFDIRHHDEFGVKVLTVCATERLMDESSEENAFFTEVPFPPCPVKDLCVNDTCTTISSVQPSEWKEHVCRFLFLIPPKEFVETEMGRLILDEELSGQLYVKGIWVADFREDELSAGVDFLNLEIDRDRRAIPRPAEIDHHVSFMWIKAVEKRPELAKKCFGLMQNSRYRDVKHTIQYATRDFCMLIEKEFKIQHPGDIFAVSNQSSQQDLNVIKNELQRQVVLCNETLLQVLYKSGKHVSLQEAINKHRVISEAKVVYVDLSDDERNVLEHAVALTRIAEPTFQSSQIDIIDTANFENIAWYGQMLHVPKWMFNIGFVHQMGKLCPDGSSQCKCREWLIAVQFLFLRQDKIKRPQQRLAGFSGRLPPSFDQPLVYLLSQLAHQVCEKAPPYCEKLHQGQVLDYKATHADCGEREKLKNEKIFELEKRIQDDATKFSDNFKDLEHRLSLAQRELMEREITHVDKEDVLKERYEDQMERVKKETKTIAEQLQKDVREREKDVQKLHDDMETYIQQRKDAEKTLEEREQAWERREETHLDELTHYVEQLKSRNKKLVEIFKEHKDKTTDAKKKQQLDALLKLCDALTEELHKDRMVCVVCRKERRTMIFKPCGHYCVCENCANKIAKMDKANKKCPVCKEPIKNKDMILHVYE